MGAYCVDHEVLVSLVGRLRTVYPETAAALITQVIARTQVLPLFLTDG
jgi:hypothetical protein